MNRPVRAQAGPRYVVVNSSGTSEGQVTNVPVSNNTNSSPTNKLCLFFRNLLTLERTQGRYESTVAIIQKYINKEIDINELGNQLKGNAAKAKLPDTLKMSLNLHIDDLRRELYFGRVKIDGINPPPESVIDIQATTVSTTGIVQATPANIAAAINRTLRGAVRPLMRGPVVSLTSPQQQQPRQIAPLQQQVQIVRPPQHHLAQQQEQTAPICRPTAIIKQEEPQAIITTLPDSASVNGSISTVAAAAATTASVKVEQSSMVAVAAAASSSSSIISGTNNSISISGSGSTGNINSNSNNNNSSNNSSTLTTGPVMVAHHNITMPTNILNATNYQNKIVSLLKTSDNNFSMTDEAVSYLSEALENFTVNFLEQAAVYACHRHEMFVSDPFYKKIDDVKAQMQVLQQMDAEQRMSEEERQKQELIRQSKSRSKVDSQEQQRIKDKVRQIQEHERSNEEYSRANQTALKAIGITPKRKWMDGGGGGGSINAFVSGGSAAAVADDSNGNSQDGLSSSLTLLNGAAAGSPAKVARLEVNSQGILNPNFPLGKSYHQIGGGTSTTLQSLLPPQQQTQHHPSLQHHPNAASITAGVSGGGVSGSGAAAVSGGTVLAARYRNKRMGLRDIQMVMDRDSKFRKFKTYKRIFSYGRY